MEAKSKDQRQRRRTIRISDRPVRSPSTDPRRPSLYTINTHPALTNPTPTAASNPHTAPPPTLIVVAALQGKAGNVVAKKAVGFGPLVTLTVAALSTGATGALVGEPDEGRMVKR
jgi:hypothetical protein